MHPIVHHPVVTHLSELLKDPNLLTRLASTLAPFSPNDEGICLRIDAVVCTAESIKSNVNTAYDKSLSLVWGNQIFHF